MVNPVWKKSWLGALLALLMIAGAPAVVWAHASLIRSDPADNALLAQPPREVHLWFSEAISPDFSGAQVLDINGQPVKGITIRVNPAENLLILIPPPLAEGLYSVRWTVLSEADGHFTQGLLVFGIGANVNLSNAAALETETIVPLPEVLLRWLNFSVLLTLVGSVVIAYLVLRPTASDIGRPAINRVRRAAQRRVVAFATVCSGLAVVVGLGLLLWQVLTLASTLPDGASMMGAGWQLLSRTRWGLFWLLRQGSLLALLGVLFCLFRRTAREQEAGEIRVRQQRIGLLGTGLLLLALLLGQGLTGHAAALTTAPLLAVLVDTLHLLAASLWVGGLLALLVGFLSLLRRDSADFAMLVRASWGRFSGLAAVSVGLLVATGLYNTGQQVASPDALITTLYGQALLTKIGLVLGVGLLGLFNSMLLHPRLAAPLARWLRRPPGWTPLTLNQLPRLIWLEASLGLLIILATGVITAAPPARGPEFEVAADEIPGVLDQMADDMLITFSAKPNRPGQNMFTVRAVSARRPPPAEVMRVILRFTFLGQEMGRTSANAVEIEPGLYQVGGNYLSLAGDWQVQVVVRRRGIEDSVAQFNWVVAPPGPARPVLLSRQPLESILTVAGGVMGLILLVISAGWWGPGRWLKLWLVQAQPTSIDTRSSNDETDLSSVREFGDDDVAAAQPCNGWLRHQPAASASLQREYDAGS